MSDKPPTDGMALLTRQNQILRHQVQTLESTIRTYYRLNLELNYQLSQVTKLWALSLQQRNNAYQRGRDDR